mmetsp:Transcript_541/g.1451  ORF Transcript_541/g.1451 Transcript_541/m.1451 type:complete len:542 (-) Transcript_541:1396-3021(-)|eukprot:CAMPEP_0202862418 /NCGR_PEP_ID=MMETSP1391-20130828/3468_1 /ASSEMBLY_ACC=CAM_ASM_000867 /TAXON_ID=1034604 /ORGANISM="Chlamydomonas leiostraca, Strain SAG 11-49" /LENGTH=541 /DNA_ID=CAMNT_0049541955 /DNA_START=89 /DNA_END=1714 /DNA_ORIENTATION=-
MADLDSKFLKGIALSVWQNSSDTASQWTKYIKDKGYLGQRKNAKAFEKSNDFWNMYETDIKLAAGLGATAFRFCFEWARIMPEGPGKVDESAMTRFSDIIACVRAHGMEPMVTLHHFTHPQWFEARGGFAEEANIPLFVDYCKLVFERFHARVTLWSTFNEPTCFAFVGYIVGLWAPGQLMRLNKAGTVLCNLMKAHCTTYRALKAAPGGAAARVGLVHQHISFVPRHNLPHVRTMCKWMTFWFGTYTVLNFFQHGVFEWDSPMSCGGPRVLHVDEGIRGGEQVTDWWGINYYSRPAVHWNFGMGASEANEPVSDTHFRLYPQGLYDSIKDASVLGVPMYITETGLADAKDRHRAWFIRTHYGMLLKALRDGYDVRGCFFWTLMDNIEWHEGFHIKFGLYKWEPQYADQYASTNNRPPQGLTLREGGKALHEIYSSWPDALGELRAHAAKEWGGAATSTGGAEEGAGLVAGGAAVKPSPSAPVSVPAVAAGHKGGEGSKAVHLSATAGSAAPPAPAAAAPAAAVDAEEVEIERVGLVGQQA